MQITRRKIGFLILLAVSILIYIWYYTPVKKIIKNKLVQEIHNATDSRVSFMVEDIGLGLGYMELDSVNVSWNIGDKPMDISVPTIRIHYNIIPLFFFKTSILDLIDHISIEEPTLILPLGLGKNKETKKKVTLQSFTKLSSQLEKIRQLLLLQETLPKLEVNSATIVLQKNGDLISIFEKLDGNVFLNEKNDLVCVLEERNIFRQKKVEVELALLTEEKAVSSKFSFYDFQIANLATPVGNENFNLFNGVLNGDFSIYLSTLDGIKTSVNSELYVSKVEGKLFDKFFMVENFDIKSEENFLILNSTPVLWGGNEISIWAAFEIYPELQTNFKMIANDFKLSSISGYLNKDKKLIDGIADFHGDLNYTLNEGLKFNGFVVSDSLKLGNSKWNGLIGRVEIENETLILNLDTLKRERFCSSLEGEIKLKTLDIDLNINSRYFIKENLLKIIEKVNGANIDNSIKLSGNLKELDFVAESKHYLIKQADTLLQYQGKMRFASDTLLIDLNGIGKGNKSGIYALIDNIYDSPDMKILDIQNIPFFDLVTYNPLNKLSKKVHSSFYFAGDFEQLTGKIQFYDPNTLDTYIEFNGDIKNIFSDFKEINADFSLSTKKNPLNGRLYLANSQNKWFGFWDIKDYLRGDFRLDNVDTLLMNSGLELQLSITDFPFFKYLMKNEGKNWEAFLNAEVDIKGKLNDLKGNMQLELKDAIFNKVGYYNLTLDGDLQGKNIVFYPVNLTLNNVPVLQGNITYDIEAGQLGGELFGEDVETSFIVETFIKDKDLVLGKASYDLKVRGTLTDPQLLISAKMPEGIIYKENIKNVYCEVVDSLDNLWLFKKEHHHFFADTLYYGSDKNYSLSGKGTLPLSLDDSLNFCAKINGNILAHLPRYEEFFEKVDLDGQMEVEVYGSLRRPKFEYLKADVTDGEMLFKEILKPLTNLKASIEKKRGDPFVKIYGISGKFDESTAWVYNLREVEVEGEKLATWDFDALGVNLGVGIMKTDARGIPLNLRGLQEDNVYGYYAVAGFNPDEEFYFGGPLEKPYARGSATIRNARVTFPFLILPDSPPEPGKMVRFLESIDCDIKGYAGKGVYYFVDIPAYIGSVYLDLDIDRDSHLHFKGKVEDESIRVDGQFIGNRGRVEYLETRFKVEEFGAFFNFHELFPEVYGRAYTTLRDSMNTPYEIFLELYAVDPITKQEVQRGRWEDFMFKLVSSDQVIGDNQELVLAKMGYSVGNISSKAKEMGAQLTENYLIRPLVKPVERYMERKLRLDYVRFRSAVAKNLLSYSLGYKTTSFEKENSLSVLNPELGPNPAILLLQSSEMTFGKYLDRNLFLSYTAQVMAMYEASNLQLNQKINLEYRFFKNWLLEVGYDYFKNMPYYYNYDSPHNMSIRLRHSFTF